MVSGTENRRCGRFIVALSVVDSPPDSTVLTSLLVFMDLACCCCCSSSCCSPSMQCCWRSTIIGLVSCFTSVPSPLSPSSFDSGAFFSNDGELTPRQRRLYQLNLLLRLGGATKDMYLEVIGCWVQIIILTLIYLVNVVGDCVYQATLMSPWWGKIRKSINCIRKPNRAGNGLIRTTQESGRKLTMSTGNKLGQGRSSGPRYKWS